MSFTFIGARARTAVRPPPASPNESAAGERGGGGQSIFEVTTPTQNPAPSARPVKVWIDLDNTPHVPFFIPIVRELRQRGYAVVLTARDAFQVCELADKKGLAYVKVGRHYGKNPVMKVLGLFWRALQLLPFFLR